MNHWTARNSLRDPERAWVGAQGSLTAWLVATGRVFSVEVLQQGRQHRVALRIVDAVSQLQATDQGADGGAQGLDLQGGIRHLGQDKLRVDAGARRFRQYATR